MREDRLAAITGARSRRPEAIAEAAAARRRPEDRFDPGGHTLVIAADHPVRGELGAGADALELVITPERAGWGFSGLRILEVEARGSHAFDTGEDELIVLPLAGSCSVTCDGERFALDGREHVFSAVSDFAYLPRDAHVEVASDAGGRFALPSARASRRLEPRRVPAEEVPVELRGAGQASRQVNNFCSPEAFPADRLIAVEVLTPGGNWSSYPPHKHDEDIPGVETALEEIYYFEVARDGFAYQRAYGGGVDICREVRTGDAVLLPSGYHGPSMAAPGYDLYYLNVMAGPGERAWRFTDDPAHAWIRDTWAGQELDPRLPMTSARIARPEAEQSSQDAGPERSGGEREARDRTPRRNSSS